MWGEFIDTTKVLLVCFLLAVVAACPVKASGFLKKNKEVPPAKTGEYFVVEEIVVSGNQSTKTHIILKELTFNVGDSIAFTELTEKIEKSRQNLLNTSLFNYVYITHTTHINQKTTFYIKVEERWYLWAFPIFEQADRNVSSFVKNGNWDMMNYGLYVRKDNFRGRQETLKFRIKAGYSTHITFSYQSPDVPKRFGWGFLVDYNMFDQLAVSTLNDQPVYLKTPGETLYKTSQNILTFNYKHSHYTKQMLTFSFRTNEVSDSVLAMNNLFLGTNQSHNNYFEVGYTFSRDTRDNRAYPLKGTLASANIAKTGIGSSDPTMDYVSLLGRLNTYAKIGSRFDIGTEMVGYSELSNQNHYFNKMGLGYKEYISGFEYYVVDGNKYGMAKNRLLFELVPTTVKNLRFISASKFSKIHYAVYLRAFYDAGYVWNQTPLATNKLANKYLYGYGTGVDIVTYYDKAFSFYYAFNSIGLSGFFFNLNLKI